MVADAPVDAKVAQLATWSGLYEDSEDTPAELRWPVSIRTYRKMRSDTQVLSLLRATALPILRTPWRVDGSGCRPEVAEHVAADLGLPLVGQEAPLRPVRMRGRFSWAQHLRHVMLQDVYGHSVFNQVYRINERTGLAHLRKLLWVPPWTISDVKIADDGGLVSITQNTGNDRPVPVSALVWYANEREGPNWLGQSMLRGPYRPWLLKDRLQRVGVLSIERNGMGVVVVTAAERQALDDPDGTKSEQDIADGLTIATNVRSGEAAGASLPHGAKLELLGVSGTLPDSSILIRYFDEQMARSFLGHFLNLGTETGSWALGSTFADFFTLALQAKGEEIADVTTQHVIEDLVDLNWGEDEPAPRLVFDEIGSQSPVTVEALKLLVDAGLLDPDEVTKQFVRTRFGIPAGDDEPDPDPEPEPDTAAPDDPEEDPDADTEA